MKSYFFYHKNSPVREPLQQISASSRLKAALYFAKTKNLPLREFLKIFSISR